MVGGCNPKSQRRKIKRIFLAFVCHHTHAGTLSDGMKCCSTFFLAQTAVHTTFWHSRQTMSSIFSAGSTQHLSIIHSGGLPVVGSFSLLITVSAVHWAAQVSQTGIIWCTRPHCAAKQGQGWSSEYKKLNKRPLFGDTRGLEPETGRDSSLWKANTPWQAGQTLGHSKRGSRDRDLPTGAAGRTSL